MGLGAMEEGAMEHHEAVASEVASVEVVVEAMRHTEISSYSLRHCTAKLGETVAEYCRSLLDFCNGVRRACTTTKRLTRWIPGQDSIWKTCLDF